MLIMVFIRPGNIRWVESKTKQKIVPPDCPCLFCNGGNFKRVFHKYVITIAKQIEFSTKT